jgi:hypothetical protein
MKTMLAFALLIVALVTTGCGPKWVVVVQAAPNPMTSASKFSIEKAALDPSFRVGDKTEQEWMGEKSPETKDKWDGDKVAISELFVEGFMRARGDLLAASAPGEGAFAVRAKYIHYEPGYNIGIAAAPTELEANVEFLDAASHVVDVIRIQVAQGGGWSSGERGRECARQIGALAAKYLQKRVGL